MNAEGMGIFYSVNVTDGVGAAAENIVRVRTWYCDIDGLPEGQERDEKVFELLDGPLPPSAIVATRNGLHCYWYRWFGGDVAVVDDRSYQRTNLGIIRHFGGDESVKDLARVLRLPDTLHLKGLSASSGVGYEVRVIHELPDPPFYTAAQIREAFPPPELPKVPPPPRIVNEGPRGDLWNRVVGALGSWRPVETVRHRAMLVAIGVALKYGIDRHRCYDDLYAVIYRWDLPRNAELELRRAIEWVYGKNRPAHVSGLERLGVHVPRPEGTLRT